MLQTAARAVLDAWRGGDPSRLAGALDFAAAACRGPAADGERRELLEAIVEAMRTGRRNRVFERLLAHLA